ncbi:uncharacterized protein LOC103634758 [Zea mays]|uniref:uncharacterized protein LOC103634758 n=1 Tax=Zea mays TaxID=4577 RepID=UPI001E276754|nr:uncharacterized protein LOC103634758 [Zea mays]
MCRCAHRLRMLERVFLFSPPSSAPVRVATAFRMRFLLVTDRGYWDSLCNNLAAHGKSRHICIRIHQVPELACIVNEASARAWANNTILVCCFS